MLLPSPSAVLLNFRDLLVENVLRLRIPYTSFIVSNVQQGVLFSYAASMLDGNRKAASRPADLPIEQPSKFEFIINLNTARALGLTIPQSLLLRADQVIE